MTTLLERIDARVSAKCLAKTCRKEGCRLRLDGLPRPRRLIDMDHGDAPAVSTCRRRRASTWERVSPFSGSADIPALIRVRDVRDWVSGVRVDMTSDATTSWASSADMTTGECVFTRI